MRDERPGPPVPTTALKRAAANSFHKWDADADSSTESESETERLKRYPARRKAMPRETASHVREQLEELRSRTAGKKALKTEMEGEGGRLAYRTRSAAAASAAAAKKTDRVKLEEMPDLRERKPEVDDEESKPGTGQVFVDGVDATSNWDVVMRARRTEIQKTKIKTEPMEGPELDMGLFAFLPGELRNRIYRFALVEGDGAPFLVSMEKLTCNVGACVHMRMPTALPGILSACQQIRSEGMPIFIAENSFKFDDELVKARCVANWLRVIGPYAELVSKIILDIVVWEIPLAMRATSTEKVGVHYEMGLQRNEHRHWLLLMDHEIVVKATNEARMLDGYVVSLAVDIAEGKKSTEVALREFVWSDWLAKLVFLCRK